MKYGDISPTMRGFIGCREGFRRLGFSADSLFLLINKNNGNLSCCVKLIAQHKEFLVEVGPVDDEAAFVSEYARVCEAVNAGLLSPEDSDRIFDESIACQKRVEFCYALARKGFFFPRALS
jgi:hypothetical protein